MTSHRMSLRSPTRWTARRGALPAAWQCAVRAALRMIGAPSQVRSVLVAPAIAYVTACAPRVDPPPPDVDVTPAASAHASGAESAPPPAVTAAAEAIPDGAPLRAGRVRFEGMVRPTKGGLDVRGVTFDPSRLIALLPRGAGERSQDSLLGAKLAIVAELVGEEDARGDGSEVVQRREGAYFRARQLERVEVVAEPVRIEGKLERSKGFYAVAGRLVTADDLRWSLVTSGGDFAGKQVRLFGQPRTVVCEPNAQCLTSGALPLFDVGRAEIVPGP